MGPAVLLILLAACAQAATVSGVVYLRSGADRQPLAGAWVTARAGEGGDLVRGAATDTQGRYTLPDLPTARLAISASRRGYFSRAIASGEERLLVDTAADESLAGADFDIFAGGVITGRVTDFQGEPLEGVELNVWRITHFGGRHRAATSAGGSSDDRGVYRIFGLEPGRYILLARPSERLGDQRPVAVYYPGRADESRAEEIEITPGGETSGVDLTIGAEPSYRLSGKIVEVERERFRSIVLEVLAAANMPGRIKMESRADADGNFVFSGLPEGTYVITARERRTGEPGEQILAHRSIEVHDNVAGLAVRPGRPASIAGRIVFAAAEFARRKPEQITVRVIEKTGDLRSEAMARAPEYRFELHDLWPGAYTFEALPGAGGYLNRAAENGKRLDPPEIALGEGGAAGIELEIAFGLGRVRGLAKAQNGAPLPHARVALAKLSGSPVEFRTAQADQRGRWAVTDVRPGEYRICTWPAISTEALYAPETWQQAGRAVKQVTIDPGAEIEIELTARATAAGAGGGATQ